MGGKPLPIGPSVMMEAMSKKKDMKVIASLFCGTNTFSKDPDDISKRICGMLKKLNPDIVICGPAFYDQAYAKMCAFLANTIYDDTNIAIIASMAVENKEIIEAFKDKI